MKIQKTTGIVLSSRGLGEADVVATILTRDFGKARFIFKGLKKSRKRPLSAADPGTLLHLVYYARENREYAVVNELEVRRQVSEARENLEKLYHLLFMLEATDRTTAVDNVDTVAFDLLAAGLEALAGAPRPCVVSAFYTLHLLRFHGILPTFGACRDCGATDFNGFSFDIVDLRLLCDRCRRAAVTLPRAMRDFLTLSLGTKFRQIDFSPYGDAEVLHLLFYLSLFMENYFHIELKTKEFILQG